MNLDDLTIGQARELARLFGTASPSVPTAAPLGSDRIGKIVLVRSRGSGVWIGRLVARMTTAAGHSVQLADARRLWSWQGAGECSSLALTGPSGGKIGPVCAPIVHEVLEEHEVTTEAAAAVGKIKVWTR